MRLTTVVWARFESKGKPDATQVVNDQLGRVAKQFLIWLTEHAMGHYMKVTIARTHDELEKWSREVGASRASSEALLGDFERALNELGLGEPTPPPPEEDAE